MKMTLRLSYLLFSIVCSLSFQNCTETSTSGASEGGASTDTTVGTTEETTKTTEASKSEMNFEQQEADAKQHAEDLSFIYAKQKEIINEHIHKTDKFTFECTKGEVTLERQYNDNDEIHLMSYHLCGDDGCSTKHHYFWENKLIYQFHHHEVAKDGKQVVDDHRTYFKDGKIVRCLESRYSYVKGEVLPEDNSYEEVDCTLADKISKEMEKLLTLSEEEAKAFLCK